MFNSSTAFAFDDWGSPGSHCSYLDEPGCSSVGSDPLSPDSDFDELNGTAGPNVSYFEDLIELPSVRFSLIGLHIGANLLSIAGNGFLVVYIIWHRTRNRSNATSNLILNLSSCDLIGSTIYQPIRLLEILTSHVRLEETVHFCRLSTFFGLLFSFVGFHTVVAISIERWLIICHPLKAKHWLTRRKSNVILLLVWTTASLLSLPYSLFFTRRFDIPLASNVSYKFCSVSIFGQDASHTTRCYTVFIFVVYYAVPVSIILSTYSRIFCSLVNNSSSTYNRISVVSTNGTCCDPARDAVSKALKNRKSLAKMMMVIAVCFAVCHAPLFFTILYASFGFRISKNPVFILMVIKFVPALSSIINPFVYSIRVKTLRRGITGGSIGGRVGSPADRSRRSNAALYSHSTLQPTAGTRTLGSPLMDCNDILVATVSVARHDDRRTDDCRSDDCRSDDCRSDDRRTDATEQPTVVAESNL